MSVNFYINATPANATQNAHTISVQSSQKLTDMTQTFIATLLTENSIQETDKNYTANEARLLRFYGKLFKLNWSEIAKKMGSRWDVDRCRETCCQLMEKGEWGRWDNYCNELFADRSKVSADNDSDVQIIEHYPAKETKRKTNQTSKLILPPISHLFPESSHTPSINLELGTRNQSQQERQFSSKKSEKFRPDNSQLGKPIPENIKNSRDRVPWTNKEDEYLKLNGPEADNMDSENWKKIAYDLARSSKACQDRYKKILFKQRELVIEPLKTNTPSEFVTKKRKIHVLLPPQDQMSFHYKL